jgi:hypothetical protein
VPDHQNDEALAALDVSLELNPSFAQAYFAKVSTCCGTGREIEAETLLDRATMLSPRDSHISFFPPCTLLGTLFAWRV